MFPQVQVGQAGEKIVGAWLAGRGYTTNIDTKLPGSTDIEAVGSTASLLVQVKTAVSPSGPPAVTSEEAGSISARAKRLGWQAWEARVAVDRDLRPVGEIQWRRLDA